MKKQYKYRKIIIRNDDVGYDTDIENFKKFCEICDKNRFQILQAITPSGKCLGIDSSWTNEQLEKHAFSDGLKALDDNKEVYQYLKTRKDLIGVHGLYHSHQPTLDEVRTGRDFLNGLGLKPSYFVTPFNEGEYPTLFAGLKVSAKCDSLETCIVKNRMPTTDIIYCHSWRFGTMYSWEKLDNFLNKLRNETIN